MPDHALVRILTLRCEAATRLASDSLDGPLGRVDRIALGLHLWICGPCRRFLRQIRELREMAGQSPEVEVDGPPMPEDLRERIDRAMRGE